MHHSTRCPRLRLRFLAATAAIPLTLPAAAERTLDWSGYSWSVRDSKGQEGGPGRNVFSADPDHVFVDEQGNLHLSVWKDAAGVWTCSEVVLDEKLGYGTYEWEVSTRYDLWADNIVGGLFTYLGPPKVAAQTAGEIGNGQPDTPHEIDIEFTGAWGPGNLFYTTHDPDVKSPSVSYNAPLPDEKTTQRFTWSEGRIVWESFHGHVARSTEATEPIVGKLTGGDHRSEVAGWVYEGPVVPEPLNETLNMNLWIFDKGDWPDHPTNERPHKMVVKSFTFTPLD